MASLLLRIRSRPITSAVQRLHFLCFSTSVPYAKDEEKLSSVGAGYKCNFIHPSAVVHPDAILGQGVSIGPFCTVGPFAKLGNDCQLYPGSHVFGNSKLGDNCMLMIGAVVGDELPGCTVIGDKNIIGHHAVVGIKCQDMKYKPGNECYLQIGDNNEIREFASIHRSSQPDDKTVIGNNNLIMGSCHIAHDCKVGDNNIFANNTLLAGHVIVEDFTYTAGATIVHQFCHIGSFSFIGCGSAVTQDVPKYTMVSGERAELRGLNLEGLKRRGFSTMEAVGGDNQYLLDLEDIREYKPDSISPNFLANQRDVPVLYHDIRSLRAAYRKIFMRSESDGNSLSIDDRLTELEKDEELGSVAAVHLMVQSIRDSFAEDRRGICKFRSWTRS